MATRMNSSRNSPALLQSLYFQVIVGVLLGVAVGLLWPEFGAKLKPLGDGFIKLVKMLIAPVIFLTVSLGSPTPATWARPGGWA